VRVQNVTFVGIDFQGKLIENDGQKLMVAQEQAGLLKRWANLHGVMDRFLKHTGAFFSSRRRSYE